MKKTRTIICKYYFKADKLKILLLLFLTNIFSVDQDKIDSEVNQIDELISEVEEEIKVDEANMENKINTTDKQNDVDIKENVKDIVESRQKGFSIYNLSQIAGEESHAGEAGDWLFSVLYESASYADSKRKHGVEVELSWVFDLTYVSVHAISNIGYYQGSESKRGFFPIGLGGEILIGYPGMFFLSSHYMYEYTKQEANDFYLFSKYGFGLYFDVSNLNEKSQFQLYRNHGIRRTYLILKYNKRSTTQIDVYSDSSITAGFGFEY